MTRDESMKLGEYEGYIIRDEDPQNPRTEWDNLGRMVCCHQRYNLGDTDDVSAWVRRSGNAGNWTAIEKHLREEEDAALILPLYLYDHGGLTMSTGPFGDRWDSGQVGFIYVTHAALDREYSTPGCTREIALGRAHNQLEAEVATYDAYLRGDVYGWQILDCDGNHVDGCFGFFGDDGRRSAMGEMRYALEHLAASAARRESETAHYATEC